MNNEQSLTNYKSHHWQLERDYLTGETSVYCMGCGCEDRGSPDEFDLEYSDCDEGEGSHE